MSIEAMKQWLEALKIAQDNLRLHEDNCFLHDEGEYNRCFCGKDSLSNFLQEQVESLSQAIAEAEKQEQNKHGSPEDMYVEMHKHLNCPHCGGSGHIDDIKQEQGEPVAWLMLNSRGDEISIPESNLRNKQDKNVQKLWANATPLYTTPQPRNPVKFPTMIRRMWSGGDVQAWLDEHVNKE